MTAHQPVVIQSVDELLSCVKSCKECCKGDYISFHCPLCPPSKFKPTRKKKVENHLRAVHWKARVEGRNDITVYNKVCKRCQLLYQYREWNEGIHNFNDVLFLGLDVCHFIRAGLQNHVAIGRSVSMLQEMIGENVDTYSLHQTYLPFQACTGHDYSFHCVLCGYHPSILIFDTCRKVAFRHSVSDLSIPPGAVSDTVDAKAFWSAVENSVRNHDTRQGKNTVTPSYEFWSPWIGENSRNGDLIYNTEIKKCSQSENKDNEDPLTEPMPEETIINMLKDEKVSTIRRICREVGVKPEGSSVDMIKRLRDMSISRGAFDKAYEKLFGCSGGWAVGCCHHGVVYAIKSLRSESSRDYLDIERSLKHRPNVTICDIAYLLARQANKIIPHFYSPNEGRLAPDTDLNIARAEKGELDCEAEFLTNPILSPDCVESNKNPVTGSDVHYALIDWFHQENCKSKQEILRRCSLLPELSGIFDTQAVEQLFSSLKRDIYYLNNMSPVKHIFLFRLVIQLRNVRRNRELLRKHTTRFGQELFYNQFGQVCQKYLTEAVQPTLTDDAIQTPVRSEIVVDWEGEHDEMNEEIADTPESGRGEPLNCALTDTEVQDNTLLGSTRSQLNHLYEDIQKLLQTPLSADDFNHLHRNVSYANTVLFVRAPEERILQVSAVNTEFSLFQVQGTSNYCLCCLNNVPGPLNGDFPITIEDMDGMADKLWLDMVKNPSFGLTVLLEPLRDREGYYSFEVLQAMAMTKGFHLIHINHHSISKLSALEVNQQIREQEHDFRLIIRLRSAEHWLAIKTSGEDVIIMDSTKTSPELVTEEYLGDFVKENTVSPGSVWVLKPFLEPTPSKSPQQTSPQTQEAGIQPDLEIDTTSSPEKLPLENSPNSAQGYMHSRGNNTLERTAREFPHFDGVLEESHQCDHQDRAPGQRPYPSNVYNLRKPVPKQKRPSSWIYDFPPRHCLCRQKDDGRLYWQCNECKGWYHPTCIGVSESNEPDIFVCPSCTKHQSPAKDPRFGENGQLFCVCNKAYDGRTYWQCKACAKWFHPDCMDGNEDSNLTDFVCESCLDNLPKKPRKTRKISRSAVVQVSSEDIQVSRIIPFADEELNNEEQDSNTFICVPDVISQAGAIDQYVEDLLTDRGSNGPESSELDIFLTNPRREFLKGFGFGYILHLAYTYLDAYVEKKFFKLKLRDKRRPATSGFVSELVQLPGTERIQKILNVDGYEGTVRNMRCKEALVRDVAILLVSNKLHISLPEARRRCCETEHSSLHTALKISEQLRASRSINSTES